VAAHAFVIALVLVCGVALEAEEPSPPPQRPTLVERAREHGGLNIGGDACGWVNGPPTLESLLADMDVVVHGTVVAVVGRLSEDQQEVWTDYTVQPIEVVADRTNESKVAQSSEPPILTSFGGTVVIEGLTISQTRRINGSYVRLTEGEQVVVFGTARAGRFHLEPFGVFPVEGSRVRPNGRWPKLTPESGSMDLPAFLARVRQITSGWDDMHADSGFVDVTDRDGVFLYRLPP